jgi:mercuric ion transport protein
MNDKKLLRGGLVGSVIAALCCFTPLLVLVVAGVGLSAIIGWLDYALFPILFASLAVVTQALWLQAGKPGPRPKNTVIVLAVILSVVLFWLEFRFALRISVAAMLAVAVYGWWAQRNSLSDVDA